MRHKIEDNDLRWIIEQLEDLHNGIAGALAFSEKIDHDEAYSAFMKHVDKIIEGIYRRKGKKRPYATVSKWVGVDDAK